MEFDDNVIEELKDVDIADLEKFILTELNKDNEESIKKILNFLNFAHDCYCVKADLTASYDSDNSSNKDDEKLFYGFDEKIFRLFTDENLMKRLLEVFSSYLDDILKQYKENINNTNIDNGSKEKIHKFMEGLQYLLRIPPESVKFFTTNQNVKSTEDSERLTQYIIDSVVKISIKLIEEDLELDLYYDYMFDGYNYQELAGDNQHMNLNLLDYLTTAPEGNRLDEAILTKFTNINTLEKIIKTQNKDKKIISKILIFIFMVSIYNDLDYFNEFFQRFAQNIIKEKDCIVQQIGSEGFETIIEQLLGLLPIIIYNKDFFTKFEYLDTVIDIYNIYNENYKKDIEEIKKLFNVVWDILYVDYYHGMFEEHINYEDKYDYGIIDVIDCMNKPNSLDLMKKIFFENIEFFKKYIGGAGLCEEDFEVKIIQQVLICYILKKSNYEHNSILNMLKDIKDVFNSIFESCQTYRDCEKFFKKDDYRCSYNIEFFIKNINNYFPEYKCFFNDIENYCTAFDIDFCDNKNKECYSIDYEKVNNSFVEILVYKINKIYSSNRNINHNLIHNIFEKIVSSENYKQPHNLMSLIKCVSDIKDKKILNHFKEILHKYNKSEYIKELEENEEIRSRKRSAQDVYKNESPIKIIQLPGTTLQPRQNILKSSRSMLQPNSTTKQQLGLDITSRINGILVRAPIMLMQNNNLNNINIANNFVHQNMELYEHINDSIDEFDSIDNSINNSIDEFDSINNKKNHNHKHN